LGIKLTRRNGSEKTKCPQCSDGRKNKTDKPLSVSIANGEYRCHNCGWKGNVRSFERKREYKTYEKPDPALAKNIVLREKVVEWFKKRAISESTLNRFLVFCREEWMPQTQQKENCIGFPYFRDGVLVNVKYRDGRKNFRMVKDAELILFNMQGIGSRKKCILVEGEPDCMAVYEAGYGQDYEPVGDRETGEAKTNPMGDYVPMSVPNGASKGNQKLEYLDNCSEYLLEMEEIIIATDGDEAGEMLKEELSIRLGIEKCKFIIYPYEEVVPNTNGGKRRCKDLNEVLFYLGKEAVRSCINNAQSWPIDGIHYIEDIFPSMLDNLKKEYNLPQKLILGKWTCISDGKKEI
jgi:twinkle protein